MDLNKLVFKNVYFELFESECTKSTAKHPFQRSDGPERKKWLLPHLEFYCMSGPGLPSHHENEIHICLNFFSSL